MSKAGTVKEKDLHQVLVWLRDLRVRAYKKNIDPWALRQGILMILYLDTVAALERGVPHEDLQKFDRIVEANAAETQLGKGGAGS